MNGCFAGMCVYFMSAWCPKRPEEGIGFPGTGVKDDCEPPFGCWTLNPSFLPEQVFFTVPQNLFFCTHYRTKFISLVCIFSAWHMKDSL